MSAKGDTEGGLELPAFLLHQDDSGSDGNSDGADDSGDVDG